MNKALVGKKILIIDDEVVFRTMLTEYFSHEKACVYATDNGSQALLLLEEGLRPDLIFLLLLFHVLTTWLKLMICCALALRTFFLSP